MGASSRRPASAVGRSVGPYDDFDDISGDSTVASIGASAPLGPTPFSLGGSLGIVSNDVTAIGTTMSVAFSVGVDAITPIDLGGLACHTEVLQTQGS